MHAHVRPFVSLALVVIVAGCGAAATPTPASTPVPPAVASPDPTASPTPIPAPPSTPAPATAGPADQAIHVTGTEVLLSVTDFGTTETVAGVEQMRGLVATTQDTTSDPRVTGTGTIGGNYDRWEAGATQWGTYSLVNDGGSWAGTWAGIAYPDVAGSPAPIEDASVWLVGSGGYGGLGYYFHFNGSNGTYEIDGLVFPGSPPTPSPAP
jgi:hypothetical protein